MAIEFKPGFEIPSFYQQVKEIGLKTAEEAGETASKVGNYATTIKDEFIKTNYAKNLKEVVNPQLSNNVDLINPAVKLNWFNNILNKMHLGWTNNSMLGFKPIQQFTQKHLGATILKDSAQTGIAYTASSGVKGFATNVLAKTPVLGALINFGFEIPDVYRTFRDQGIWEGTKQTVRSGGKATGGTIGMTAGAIIGQTAIPIPFVGAFIGGCIGQWIGSTLGERVANVAVGEKKPELPQMPTYNPYASLADDPIYRQFNI